MIRVSPIRVRRLSVVVCALVAVGLLKPAQAQIAQKLSFDELVQASDQIFTADCTDRQTVLENGNIVTRYHLRPIEFWKGQIPLSANGDFELAEHGGNLPGPVPIGQWVSGMADMAPGEQVLLFTANPKQAAKGQYSLSGARQKAAAIRTPHIVGRWQGRHTVLRHPETGQPLVARANASLAPGSAVNPQIRQMMIEQNRRFAGQPSPGAPGTAKNGRGGTQEIEKKKLRDRQLTMELEKKYHKLAEQIDKSAQKAQAERQQRQSLAGAKGAAAENGDIFQYEPLESVKGRVLRAMMQGKK